MTDQLLREKRQRFIRNLIKEAILNVLAEQEAPVQTTAVPPAPAAPAPETNASLQQTPPAEGAEEPQQFTVEAMVDKLNVLRGGRSFTDPEVFGRLTTFFNNLTDEQKVSFENLLTELGKAVIGATEEEAGLEGQGQQANQAAQQPPPPPAAPQAPAPAPAPTTSPSL